MCILTELPDGYHDATQTFTLETLNVVPTSEAIPVAGLANAVRSGVPTPACPSALGPPPKPPAAPPSQYTPNNGVTIWLEKPPLTANYPPPATWLTLNYTPGAGVPDRYGKPCGATHYGSTEVPS